VGSKTDEAILEYDEFWKAEPSEVWLIMKSDDIDSFIGMPRKFDGAPRFGVDIDPAVVDDGCGIMLSDASVRLGGR